MTDARTCPTCGATLPPDAPRDAGADACPRCLMAAGLVDTNAGQGESDDAAYPRERLIELFPELELGEIVGRGGMGVVWKARQRNLSRDVALKILTVGGDDGPAFAERFSREARALARLDHRHIVRVLECGEREGVCFLLMEFVDGANLRELMRHGDLQPEQALAIVPQICDALQYAHERGVVHRDIKPENVLIDTNGRVRIADFGLAKLSEGAAHEATLTRAGQVMGTLHYMAPEQIESPLLVDHRADIYSLGVVFYEMLTGELPLGRFEAPSERVCVDVRLDEVVLRALSKRRELRYQSAGEVKTEVTAIAAGPAQVAAAPAADVRPVPRPIDGPARRLSRKAVAAFCLSLSAVAIAIAPPLIASLGAGVGTAAIYLILLVCGPVALTGFVLSIWSWVDIVRSDRRLYGLRFAIPGVFMPILLPVVAGSFYMLLAAAPVPQVGSQPVTPQSPSNAEPSDPDSLQHLLWTLASADELFTDEQRLALTDPDDREMVRGLEPAIRGRWAREGKLGLALLPADALPAPLDTFNVWRQHPAGVDDARAQVTLKGATHTIDVFAVPRVVDGESHWYFEAMPVLIRRLDGRKDE